MAKSDETERNEPTSEHRAATTPEGRENQLVNLAVELAEKQLRDGTASAQVLTHYLKAGSTRDYLERRKIEMDIELAEAKRKQMAQADRMEVLIENAINAMRGYQGRPEPSEEENFA